MLALDIHSLQETQNLAHSLAPLLEPGDILYFQGDLGAGKTTLIKELVGFLSPQESVTSPTFNLMHLYDTPFFSICHMDLYRLKNVEEFFDLGIEDFLPTSVLCIEWPQKILPYKLANPLEILLTHTLKGRKVEFSYPPVWQPKIDLMIKNYEEKRQPKT